MAYDPRSGSNREPARSPARRRPDGQDDRDGNAATEMIQITLMAFGGLTALVGLMLSVWAFATLRQVFITPELAQKIVGAWANAIGPREFTLHLGGQPVAVNNLFASVIVIIGLMAMVLIALKILAAGTGILTKLTRQDKSMGK